MGARARQTFVRLAEAYHAQSKDVHTHTQTDCWKGCPTFICGFRKVSVLPDGPSLPMENRSSRWTQDGSTFLNSQKSRTQPFRVRARLLNGVHTLFPECARRALGCQLTERRRKNTRAEELVSGW